MRSEITDLDEMLAADGERVTLRRRIGTGSTFVEVTNCLARLSGYQPEQMVGGITQTQSALILSPTAIEAAATAGTWPGAAGGGALPKIGDFIRSAGGTDRRIEAIQPARIGGIVVRFEGRILG